MNDKEAQDKIYREEATSANLTFVKRSKVNYGYFLCNKGHTIELQYTHDRRNNWKCKHCYEEKLREAAKKSDIEILGESSEGWQFRYVKKNCGCEQHMRAASILKGVKNKVCKTCYERELAEKCKLQDIEIIDAITTDRVIVQFSKCGHVKELQKAQIFRENLVCRVCVNEQYKAEAIEQGLTMIGAASNGDALKRNYTLPCGCSKDLRPSHVRESRWECDKHDNSHMIKPSIVYLIKMTAQNGKEWLKLGYARDLRSRAVGYGFSGEYEVVKHVNFNTGREAIAFEQALHKKYRNHRLDKNLMAEYMVNGKTECYDLNMKDILLKELEALDNE